MQNELTKEEKTIQTTLNKLISEEFVANLLYKSLYNKLLFQKTKGLDDIESFKFLIDIAKDEYEDHYLKLVEYALRYNFKFPTNLKDIEKNSSSSIKQLDSIKDDESPIYYINEAIKSEINSIKTYENVINSKQFPYELTSICTQIYYDEIEHLEKLKTVLNVFQSTAILSYV